MTSKKEVQSATNKLGAKRNDLKVRLISSVVLLIILAGYLTLAILSTEADRWNLSVNTWATNYIFFVLSAILTGLMLYEMIKAWGIKKKWEISALIASGLVLFVLPFFTNNVDFPLYQNWKVADWFSWWQTLIILFLVVALYLWIAWKNPQVQSWFVGLKLIGICLIIILGMRGFTTVALAKNEIEPKYGFVTIIWIWGTIILTDSLAYLGGTRFGKTPLAPKISPHKSLEGAVIGVIGATILGSLISLLVFYLVPNHDYGPMEVAFKNLAYNIGVAVPGVLLVLLTLVVAILGQFGDLFFSLIKRTVEIKDYSHLIPGHGGILDRMDSFVFTFFFIFIIIQFI